MLKQRMLRIAYCSALFIFGFTSVQAQGEDDWRLYRPTVNTNSTDTIRKDFRGSRVVEPGKIEIVVDPKIERLDERKKENPTKLNGYRVQIFFGKRDEAQAARGKFLRSHPDTRAYISYLAPNFRLRVGDFRTKLESEKFKKEIAGQFPGCYIVKDKIELPRLRPEDG